MVMFGLAVQSAGKVWFIDRMALLYDDVAPSGAAGPAQAPIRSAVSQP
jgi:hypothetical protein